MISTSVCHFQSRYQQALAIYVCSTYVAAWNVSAPLSPHAVLSSGIIPNIALGMLDQVYYKLSSQI